MASEGGTLRVQNPFNEDRLVYLTYLTTSAAAAANKVYPKTKVRMVEEQRPEAPTTRGQQQHQAVLPSLLSSWQSSSIILDPSHNDNSDVKHRTRTTAVGLVPALSTGILEFTPLEEYTVHHFRIVGVSFLAKEKTAHNVPSEFAMSPKRLSIEAVDDNISDIDDEDE